MHGKESFTYQGHAVDLSKPFRRLSMRDAIREFGNIDVDKLDDEQLAELRITYNLELKGDITRGALICALFESLCEDKLILPTFIIEHPKESTPLCKPSRKDPNFVERFELFMFGFECANAYSELNDPLLQTKLLEDQAAQLRAGSEAAHPMDEDFIEAIEIGMPPTGGVGIGMDRMIMILTDQPTIKEVIFFPFMKEEHKPDVKSSIKA